ncbi:caspase domain-containing protein [Ilyonectria destructans]|nr:caspase domain-containing protein [Ilyonectria destructans]
MASSQSTRFALLVGIDQYDPCSRKVKEGKGPITLKQLHGCVNDVQAIEPIIKSQTHINRTTILTSINKNDADLSHVAYSANPLPTYANIRKEFDNVYLQAKPGDEFFFHFSGHGGQLDAIAGKSREGSKEDCALLPMDFGSGYPAVRGWVLNMWLQRLNAKGVRVFVILDSCYASGSFRDSANLRTPTDWFGTPNLPSDEEAVLDMFPHDGSSSTRNVDQDICWDMNPAGFTLMAACEDNETAAEDQQDGKYGGIFTQELKNYLANISGSSRTVSYRSAREQIARRMEERSFKQRPRFHGEDRLALFGTTRPSLSTHLVVKIDENKRVILPVGKAHGIQEGSQFTTYPTPSPFGNFSPHQVFDFESEVTLSPAWITAIKKSNEVIQTRWSLGAEVLRVFVHSSFGSTFRRDLDRELKGWITSHVEVVPFNGASLKPNEMRLEKREDGAIDIYAPRPLVEYEGPVRGVDIQSRDVSEHPERSATAIAHLVRFGQMLKLQRTSIGDTPSFRITLTLFGSPETHAVSSGPHAFGQKFTFEFRNEGTEDLNVTIFALGPGFNIEQVRPKENVSQTVRSGSNMTFHFKLSAPYQLKDARGGNPWRTHRDIIRTIITNGEKRSWNALELPHIWDVSNAKKSRIGGVRDMNCDPDTLCIDDQVIFSYFR